MNTKLFFSTLLMSLFSMVGFSQIVINPIITIKPIYYFDLTKLVLIKDVTPQILQDPSIRSNALNLTGTNGNVSSYNPAISTSSFTGFGPYINGADKAGIITNICDNQTITLTTPVKSGTIVYYQWYKCEATTTSESVIGFPKYTWGAWTAISGATTTSYVVSSSNFSSSVPHIAYACRTSIYNLISAKYVLTTDYTGITGIARTEEPHIGSLVISPKDVCPAENILVQLGFRIVGDNVTMKWTKEATINNTITTYNSTRIDSLSIPSLSYLNGGYRYYLNISHTCNTTTKLLNDWTPSVKQALVESYAPLSTSEATKSVCINTPVTFTATINSKNEFYASSYVSYWEYKAAGSTTWTKITTDNAVFSGSSSLILSVIPTDVSYHNMQFRCTTIGACSTLISVPYTLKLKTVPDITNISNSTDKTLITKLGIKTYTYPACEGEFVTLSAVITSDSLSTPVQYRWWMNNNVVVAFSETASTYSFTAGKDPVSIKCEVRGNNACVDKTDEYSRTIDVYKKPDVSVNISKTGCGGATATLSTAFIQTSKPSYTYTWASQSGAIVPDPAAPSQITNQATGKRYYLTVTDACGKNDTASAYVSSFPALSLVCTKQDVLCMGQTNASLRATIAGGVTPYDITITKTGSTTPILSIKDTLYGVISAESLGVGEYTVQVNDACDSIKKVLVTITQPSQLVASVAKTKNVTCNSGGDGEASIAILGGTKPYTINWSNGQHTETALGLFAQKYIANVTDNNGCFASTEANIQQPAPLSVSFSKTNVSCNGLATGAIDLFISGGTPTYRSYVVSPKGDTLRGLSLRNLKAGDYSLFVADACGDIHQETITLTQPDALAYSLTAQSISCHNLTDGMAEVKITAGREPYSIKWKRGDSSAAIYNLESGYYVVQIKDACSAKTDSIQIIKPSELLVTIEKTDISCNGLINGSATAKLQGGTAPYFFNWNNGKTSETIENLYKGKYTVEVSDSKGCSKFQSLTIDEPSPLSAITNVTNNTCYGAATGSIVVTATNGKSPYTYKWSNKDTDDTTKNLLAGNYIVTVQDACSDSLVLSAAVLEPIAMTLDVSTTELRCNNEQTAAITLNATGGKLPYQYAWSLANAGSAKTIKNLAAGTYTYTLTDACGQKITNSVTFINPSPIAVISKKADASCAHSADGWISLKPNGGTAPYSTAWSFGSVADSIANLFPGFYNYSVHDAKGCTTSGMIEILKPMALEISTLTSPSVCKVDTGKVFSFASGGTDPYSYKWNNKATTANIDKLSAGIYTITVTDAKGCTAQASGIVSVKVKPYEICLITVDSSSKANKIIWVKDNDPSIDSVRIYCYYGNYRKIGQVPASAQYSVYNDYMAKPRQTSYQYAISTLDKCGNESALSPSHSTMLLWSNFSTEPNKANIEWTPYVDESGDFRPSEYYIYKGNSYSAMALIDTVPGTATIYIDNANNGARYYRVSFKKTPCVVTGLKSDSGPFSQSLSNMSEASLVDLENTNTDDAQLSIYPKPASSTVSITPANGFAQNSTIRLIATDGRTVFTQVISNQQASLTLSVEGFAKGLYQVVIEANNTVQKGNILVD